MFLQEFEEILFPGDVVEVKLPRPNLILDPCANSPHYCKFVSCRYHDDGITVTLTRDDIPGCASGFTMRVYDPAIEPVPNFDSDIYTYHGVDGECAPFHTTVGIIHPSVKTIKQEAFSNCMFMKKCIMYEGLETIEREAFRACNLLDALFFPSSLKKVEKYAFWRCSNIRIMPLPLNIDIRQMGERIVYGCDTFFQVTQIERYGSDYTRASGDQVHRAILDFYRNLPSLHKACLDVSVSAQTIHDCILVNGRATASLTDHDGMNPLHILAMNPHATLGSIEECLNADMSSLFVGDNRDRTPLNYLLENNLDTHTSAVLGLCLHRNSMME